jgi:hypothetical protein
MKKYITIILLLTFSFQAIASPYSGNTTAAAQTKAIQMCFDKLLGKAFAPENLEKINLGEGKYLDQLAATKALIVWTLGEEFEKYTKSVPLLKVRNPLLKDEQFLIPILTIVALILIPIAAIFHSSDEMDWYSKNNPKLYSKMSRNFFINSLSIVVSFTFIASPNTFLKILPERYSADFMKNVLEAESQLDVYQAFSDDEGEIATDVRKKIIKGCNVIADQVDHYTKNPDLLVSDLETMRKQFSPAVLRDSSEVFKDSILFVPLPSQKKTVQTQLQKSKP